MAPLKKMFSHEVVTHKMAILVMAPLNLENFVRVQDYAGRVMASPCSHSGDCSRHKKRAARNGDSPLRYASGTKPPNFLLGGTKTERHRDRERLTDSKTEKERDRHTNSETQRHRRRKTETQTETDCQRQRYRMNIKTEGEVDREIHADPVRIHSPSDL